MMMMRTLLSILLLSCWLPLLAQETVDKVMFRIVYKTDFVNDTTKRDSTGHYEYNHDEMALDIGSTVSKFYSLLNVRFAKWAEYTIKHGGEESPNYPRPPRPSVHWVFFNNYPEGKATTLWSELNYSLKTEEPMIPAEWKIVGDTCSILGYHCTKAEADYKGRHWSAWYTEDIPISQGPWLLGGLPGLVLKASDSRCQWVFTAIGTEQLDGKEDIDLGKKWKKYELVSKKQFYHWRRRATVDDMVRQMSGMSGVKVTPVNEDGEEYSPEEYRKRFLSPPPFNPIDLSE